MIELHQSRWQALLARLYWREPTTGTEPCGSCAGTGGTRCGYHVDSHIPCTLCTLCGGAGTIEVHEMRPRRFAWLLRPLIGFHSIEAS